MTKKSRIEGGEARKGRFFLSNAQETPISRALDAMADGLAMFDAADRLVFANLPFLTAFNHHPEIRAGMARGRMAEIAYDYIFELNHVGRTDWLAEQATPPGPDEERDRSFRLRKGGRLNCRSCQTPDGGTLCRMTGITSAEEEVEAQRRARERAEAETRAKSTFLAKMSHELRTPMNGVVSMADLLLDTELDEEQTLFARTIRTSGEALLNIINDVLDFSKMEATGVQLEQVPFDLERCVHEVAMLLQPMAAPKTVSIVADFDLFLPTHFIGDPGRFRQVLVNLAGNAVKFTETGAVLIRVVGLPSEGTERQLISITVEDTGIGIGKAQLGQIFGEYQQVNDPAHRNVEGTGLGLAIARQIVTAMGGEIWAESEPGQGSCFGFRVCLPVAEPVPVPTLSVGDRNFKVAVVSDMRLTRDILERQLAMLSLNVSGFAAARDLRAWMAGQVAPDLVVIDHNANTLNGERLAHSLRVQGCNCPIVVMAPAPALPTLRKNMPAQSWLLPAPVKRSEMINSLSAILLGKKAPKQQRHMTTANPENRGRLIVLAVEDNITNQLVMRKILESEDVQLEQVENGAQAVERFNDLRPDLVFMDICMPVMDGAEATAIIRATEDAEGLSHTPIIALTAHALPGDGGEFLAAGMDSHLTKPVKKAELLHQIELVRSRKTLTGQGGI
ncbi:MAG TPA: response regulator [Aliiroseovarius sp.]|nr:response regulator [Aliiroseovarius sp.]